MANELICINLLLHVLAAEVSLHGVVLFHETISQTLVLMFPAFIAKGHPFQGLVYHVVVVA
jgi:hypothetical protein